MPAEKVTTLVGLPDYDHLVLYTGNVLRTRVVSRDQPLSKTSNMELIQAVDDTLQTSLLKGDVPNYRFYSDKSLLEVPDLRHHSIIALDDRPDVEVTAKLFYLHDQLYPEFIDESMNMLKNLLNVSTIDTFVLSSPSAALEPIKQSWKELEKLYKQGIINNLGVSDYSEQQLAQLLQDPDFELKPSLNQVSYSCCDIPTSLMSLAKQNQIQLLYTSDCKDILSRQELTSLMQSAYAIAGKAQAVPRWVLKYDVFVKDRSIVADKGYIVVGDIDRH
ncbi:NADP-dependent oxidoreductase domain-containing protein [Gongronella butleri]|nr:NADP-dependent oxidoreductase domain-containing protein [Gongronella butleri]